MKNLLIYLFILLFILGIIPALLVVLMEKSTIFSILVGILAISLVFKMLCE